MALSRILGAASLAVVALALVSVATSWSDDADTRNSGLVVGSPSEVASAGGDGATIVAPSSTTPPTAAPATSQPAAVSSTTTPAASPTSAAPAPTTSSTAPTTTTAPTVAAHVDRGRAAELVFTGDIVPAAQLGELARHYGRLASIPADYAPMFARVASEVATADVAICHLDSTAAIGGAVSGGSRHQVPDTLLTALASSGWDGCSLAAPSALDNGEDGVAASIAAMDAAGLKTAGLGASGVVGHARYSADGIAVAHLAFTDTLEETAAGLVGLIDDEAIIEAARAARIDGAEFVIVSLHWGTPFSGSVDDDQAALADALAASGTVDLVIGHGTHLMQPIDRVGDMWVVYGLGNFLTNQGPSCCPDAVEDGAVLHVEITDTAERVEISGMSITPTWTNRVLMEVIPVVAGLDDGSFVAWQRAVMQRAYDRTEDALLARGADEFGVGLTDQLG